MFLWINHCEDAGLWEVGQTLIPITLEILGANLVDFPESIEIRNTDFVWRETDDGSIFLVKGVDVEDALAGDDCSF
jgi:hypothetical protein